MRPSAQSPDSEQDDEDIIDAKVDGVETLGAAEDAIVVQCLELIRKNPQCKRALYFPSRTCFVVTKKGLKNPKQFGIMHFKKIEKIWGFFDSDEGAVRRNVRESFEVPLRRR